MPLQQILATELNTIWYARILEPQKTRGSVLPIHHNRYLWKSARNPRQRFDDELGFEMEATLFMQSFICKQDSSELPNLFANIPDSALPALNTDVPNFTHLQQWKCLPEKRLRYILIHHHLLNYYKDFHMGEKWKGRFIKPGTTFQLQRFGTGTKIRNKLELLRNRRWFLRHSQNIKSTKRRWKIKMRLNQQLPTTYHKFNNMLWKGWKKSMNKSFLLRLRV